MGRHAWLVPRWMTCACAALIVQCHTLRCKRPKACHVVQPQVKPACLQAGSLVSSSLL